MLKTAYPVGVPWRKIAPKPWLQRAARIPWWWTDVFCGGGGSTRGILRAGQGARFGVNHSESSIATHLYNQPFVEHDTRRLTIETDYRFMPRSQGLWVSPSCVNQSNAGGRKKLDAKDELRAQHPAAVDRATAWAAVNAAEVHRYEVVVVENVPEFVGWVLFDAWVNAMYALGYEMTMQVIDAADLGAAQYRKRVIIVFTRNGAIVDLTPAPRPLTPATAILDPDLGKLVTAPRSDYIQGQIDWVADAGEMDIPYLVTYRRNAKPKRADEHPLATITAGGNHHAIATRTRRGTFFRMLRLLEKALAQDFEHDYAFCGKVRTLPDGRKVDEINRQIGNAVPPVMAQHVVNRVAVAHGFEPQEDLVAA